MPSRMNDLRLHSACAQELDSGARAYTVSLEDEGGRLFDVLVHPELELEAYELSGLVGEARAVAWCEAHIFEVCQACERAKDGLYLDPFTRFWAARPERELAQFDSSYCSACDGRLVVGAESARVPASEYCHCSVESDDAEAAE